MSEVCCFLFFGLLCGIGLFIDVLFMSVVLCINTCKKAVYSMM